MIDTYTNFRRKVRSEKARAHDHQSVNCESKELNGLGGETVGLRAWHNSQTNTRTSRQYQGHATLNRIKKAGNSNPHEQYPLTKQMREQTNSASERHDLLTQGHPMSPFWLIVAHNQYLTRIVSESVAKIVKVFGASMQVRKRDKSLHKCEEFSSTRCSSADTV